MEEQSKRIKARIDEGLLLVEALGEMFVVGPKKLNGLDLSKAEIRDAGKASWVFDDEKAVRITVAREENNAHIKLEVWGKRGKFAACDESSCVFLDGREYEIVGEGACKGTLYSNSVEGCAVKSGIAVLYGKNGIEVIKEGKRSVIVESIEKPTISFEPREGKTLIKIVSKNKRLHIEVDKEGGVLYGKGENPFYR